MRRRLTPDLGHYIELMTYRPPDESLWARALRVALVVAVYGSAGCGGEVTDVGPLTVEISPDAALLVGVGQTVRFSAVAGTSSSTLLEAAGVLWSTADVRVATIAASGIATAVAAGVTSVTATVDGYSDTALLEVFVPEVVADYEIGTSYTGRGDYVEYIPGDLPVVFSAPHGGTLTPAEIPDRTFGVTGSDRNTAQLTLAVRDAFFDRTGRTPHVVISHLHRVKLDPNREVVEAAQGNAFAERAWEEFQGFIEIAREGIASDFGGGMYFDMHGHGHPIGRLELGYLLSTSTLNQSDVSLDAPATLQMSSIRAIGLGSPIPFSQLVRGPTSLSGYLGVEGVRAVPSPGDPSPGTDPYFTGGYNTRRHGSIEDGEIVSGIQIEHQFGGIRDSDPNRRAYAAQLATAIELFMLEHFGFFEPVP